MGARLTIYETGAFTTSGFADFVCHLRRSGGTWTMTTASAAARLTDLPAGFTTSADINTGALRILVTPGANNCHATVEFWVGTEQTQAT
jgi:hypothetical protein